MELVSRPPLQRLSEPVEKEAAFPSDSAVGRQLMDPVDVVAIVGPSVVTVVNERAIG